MGERTTATEQRRGACAARHDKGPAGDGLALLPAIRARDLAAFEALYRLYHPRLTRFLLNLLGRPQLVEEVLNDTMMVVWERADSFRGASRLSTWIHAIAWRKARRAMRRPQAPFEELALGELVAADGDPEEALGHQHNHRRLMEAIGTLSVEHRAVVSLTYFQELDYREIARIMDCPVDTVKTRMFHARRYLRRWLGGQLRDWI